MAKAKILVELEIEYDELQYEDDGFIGVTDIQKCLEEEFQPKMNLDFGWDFSSEITKVIKLEAKLVES